MEPGTLLAGRYRLERHIASGGMGSVWSGRDTRLDRTVAVKILNHLLEPAKHPGDRFEQEAKALASLKGPGFVEIHDVGEDREGDRPVRFIVMELVEGASLTALLDERGRLAPGETMALIAEAAEALDAAHRRGIVHRDIKPGNLLIDADSHVRVVDFGIALLAGNPRLTPSDKVLGTLAYVAPEQLEGAELTGATDIYALGAVAYECLTGSPPFSAKDPRAVLHGHLQSEPPALPEEVPAAVSEIIMRALRKTPEERWESGAELAAACRAVAGDEAVPAPPPKHEITPNPDVLTPEPGTRRPRRIFAVAALAIVLVLITALISWGTWIPNLQEDDGATGSELATDSPSESENPTGEPLSPTPSESDDATTPGQDESGQEDDLQGDPGEADEPAPDPEPTGGEIPDVYLMQTSDAVELLEREGFENITVFQEADNHWYDEEAKDVSEDCQVTSQDPPAGQTADFDDPIRLGYYRLYYRDTVCE